MSAIINAARSERVLPAIGSSNDSGAIRIGLVNNMSDSALLATECQFRDLLTDGGKNISVRLLPFTLKEIPRSDAAKRFLTANYGGISELEQSRLDALVITGSEPRTDRLQDEAHWGSLVGLFDWAEENTISAFISCLATHAALLYFDGIERRRLARKCCGIFDHGAALDHPLMHGMKAPWQVAHSRWNELPEEEVRAAGYSILSRSPEVGLNLFIRQKRSLFVLAQGHPEYNADALAREYRRDVRRFLAGERDDYPMIPHSYFDEPTELAFDRFRRRALAERTLQLMSEFPPFDQPRLDAARTIPPSSAMFHNWVHLVAMAKAHGVPARRPPDCFR